MTIFILLQVAAYDKTQGKMAFFDPSRPQDFLFISGTKVCVVSEHKTLEYMFLHIGKYLNKRYLHFSDADTCKE